MLDRRKFLVSTGAGATVAALSSPAAAAGGLDPQNPNIKFGTTGSYFGKWNIAANGRQSLQMSNDVRMILMDIKHYGLEGFEPYAGQVSAYAGNPMALKALLQETGVELASVGGTVVPKAVPSANVTGGGAGSAAAAARSASGDPGSWLGGQGRGQLVAQMEQCARDFLQPLGVVAWKQNMGSRPKGGPTDDHLKALADTANEIGMRSKRYGVKLSLHPHIWGPMEREHEFRRVMELTDPNYVYLCLDTGHNVLGGMNTVKIVDEFFPRIAHFHLKDTFAKFQGNKETPDQTAHYMDPRGFYASVGQGGGVDFVGVFAILRNRRYNGWVVFDVDAPRAADGTGTVDDNIAASVNYLRTVLGVRLPQATGAGGLFRPM